MERLPEVAQESVQDVAQARMYQLPLKKVGLALLGLCLAAGAGAKLHESMSPRVAVIDLNFVFKHHIGFQQQTDQMKAEVKLADLEIKTRQEEINRFRKDLAELEEGSPERQQLEQEFQQAVTSLKAHVEQQQKLFKQKESQVYYDVYQDVTDTIHAYLEDSDIDVVLRINGQQMDRNDPQDVVKTLNQNVILARQHADITPIILDRVNAKALSK